jgi:DNA-binding CsgD family transcriptional regulator
VDDALELLERVHAEVAADDSVDADRRLDVDALLGLIAQEALVDPEVMARHTARLPHDLRGDTPAQQRALMVLAYALLIQGEPASRAEELVARLQAHVDLSAMRASDAMILVRLISSMGQGEEADRAAADLTERARRTGEEMLYASVQFQFAVSANQRGDLRRCEAVLRLGLEAPGMTPSWRSQYEDWLITTLSMQGRFDEAEALLERHARHDEGVTRKMLARRRMEIALDRGDHPGALQHAAEAFGFADGRVGTSGIASDYALILAAVGRVQEALSVARMNLERASTTNSAQYLGTAEHALGTALAASGDLPAALEHLARSVDVLAASPYRWNQANAEVDLGRVLVDAGRPEQARGALMAALEYAVEHGAAPIEKRAREELARAGVTVLEPTAVGARVLNPTEERIAKLAASGLSDKEIAQRLFVTTRTVEQHLAEALTKLGVGSREALGDALTVTSVP